MYRSITHKEPPATMSNQNYNLNALAQTQGKKSGTWKALLSLVNLLPEQRGKLILALVTIVGYSIFSLLPPALIGYTINHIISNKDTAGLNILGFTVLRGSGYPLIWTVCGWVIALLLPY